ncbi:hypothetical protein HY029_02120, partial [Candidatus Gottesmanbacteria bacterium]|nr:hypothetical protein [Candidatus Gottesmanbacteria bacterium]
ITNRNFLSFFVICCLLYVVCYLTIRLAQPYAFSNGNFFDFTLNQKVLDNWKQLKSFDDPNGWFPPGVQWITTKPYLFPMKNMILWGLGLPLGIISVFAITYHVLLIMYYISKKKIYLILNTKYLILFLSFFWILFLFIYQGGQFAKNMRYFIPIYPFLAIIASYFLYKYKIGTLVYGIIGILFMIYPISFISIYSHPHSRVTASNWIYENIPVGSTLSGEHWDDFLPVSLPKTNLIHEKYQGIEFPLYGVDNQAKWKDMDEKLKKVDYIILTSNRLYGSIMTVPKRYPITSRYYQALFDGSLGFTKVAEFTSRPNLPIPFIKMCLTPPFARYGIVAMKSQECTQTGISFLDDYSDESFTVYDHPKVLIFKKSKPVDYYDLLLTQK